MGTIVQPTEQEEEMEEELKEFRRAWEQERHRRRAEELAKQAKLVKGKDHAARVRSGAPGSPVIRSSASGQENVTRLSTLKRPFSDISNNGQGVTMIPSTRHGLAHQSTILPEPQTARKFVVALDYGTTFTSVCYSVHQIDEDPLWGLPQEVKTIENWPFKGSSGSRLQVPSESGYPSAPGEQSKFMRESLLADDTSETDDESASDVESQNRDPDYLDESLLDDDDSKEYLWGYEVFYQEFIACTSRRNIGLVKHAKSKLLETPYTQQDRRILGPVLDELIRRRTIPKIGKKDSPSDPRDVQDVLTHFLIKIFTHTKQQLTLLNDFNEQCDVRFVLTVPTIWSPQSSRVLQSSMQAALKVTKFGKLEHGSINNLFIISEPEAAAAFLLVSSDKIKAGETFVILDAGGGTVDTITYTVASSSFPLRLAAEESSPDGDNCGASYLNENFKKLLQNRLRDEHYLFTRGETLESLVNSLMPRFEDDMKRTVDITTTTCAHKIKIKGLIGDEERELTGTEKKRFDSNKLIMNRRDYITIFQPLLERVQALLDKQLQLAEEKGKQVKKVFLVGGFGESPSLKSHLRKYLKSVSIKLGRDIMLLTKDEHRQECVTVVAAGAVLRAYNLNNGPDRVVQSSFGFLRYEPYEPKLYNGHVGAKPQLNKEDGVKYVKSIDWFVVKGDTVPDNFATEAIQSIHTFKLAEKKFLCEEKLYVSDSATESHYSLTHPKNNGAQKYGKIEVDMTFLKDKGDIKPLLPDSGVGKQFWRVEFELVAYIKGRNLRYEVRVRGRVRKAAQVSIAAAFQPGTG